MKIEFVTEQDETGLGGIVVDGRFYGVPAAAVEMLKMEGQRLEELESYKEKYLLLSKQTARAEERREELVEVLNEASKILGELDGEGPPSMRWPIIDELTGFAAMLAAAPKPEDK